MIGLIVLAAIWFFLWIIHGCTVEKLLKEILAEIKKPKEGVIMSNYTTQIRFICETKSGLTESVGFKGIMAAIEGSIQTRSWDDNEGKKRFATEVIVHNIYFGESKRDAEINEPVGNAPIYSPMGQDDDLPF